MFRTLSTYPTNQTQNKIEIQKEETLTLENKKILTYVLYLALYNTKRTIFAESDLIVLVLYGPISVSQGTTVERGREKITVCRSRQRRRR
jgi:hypothetical protein